MHVLGIETATPIASVAVIAGEGIRAEQSLPMQGSHARTLLPLIDAVLAAAGLGLRDLDLVAVSIGPGSFTGLRIGLSVAKGLALATGLPVLGAPTLAAYARAAGGRPGLVCPVLDARKGEVYGAAYRHAGGELTEVLPSRAQAPEAFAAALGSALIAEGVQAEGSCTLIGDGVDAFADRWRAALGSRAQLIPFAELPPRAATVAAIGAARAAAGAGDDLAELEPRYCRASEAEEARSRFRERVGEDARGAS